MKTSELYLKTAFCCMACDGSVANEEVKSLKMYVTNNNELFDGVDIESTLNSYVAEINTSGKRFLTNFLAEVASKDLTEEEQLKLVELAINIIEADENIEYSEVAFFKKIRQKLSVTDEAILEKLPSKGDYLLPDIIDDSPYDWTFSSFNDIVIN